MSPRSMPAFAVLVVLAAGCAAGPAATIEASQPVAASPSSQASVQAVPPVCPNPESPNPESPVCLGTLEAGTYSSKIFTPVLTYTVPDGWQRLEDNPGNYLLFPPGYPVAGANDGGGDAIGVVTDVAAANRLCSNEAEASSNEPGVAATPAGMADEFAARAGLELTGRTGVSVGGLTGLQFDLRLADGWTGTCFYAPTPTTPIVPALHTATPSNIDHPVEGALVMRLYLLAAADGTTMAIEIDDWSDGTHLDGYSPIIESMQFD